MRRSIRYRWVLAAALAVLPGAESLHAESVRGAGAAAWRTTVVINVPLPLPAPAGVATGTLPRIARPAPGPLSGNHELDGIASFYWQAVRTANGELFDRREMTAAHKTLPFGTRVRVTNLANGQTIVVRINDRGPFKPGRVIDVSMGAAIALGMQSRGLTKVKLDVVQ